MSIEGSNTNPSDEQTLGLDEVFGRLYEKIRRLASRVRWSSGNPTLNATALAHEAYLKLRKAPPNLEAKSYDEVIRIFAAAMQQILIDAARRKNASKRLVVASPETTKLPIEDVITVAAALEELAHENPLQTQIVQCRFLLGMTADETASALRLSKRTVEREWHDAKQRLGAKLAPGTE